MVNYISSIFELQHYGYQIENEIFWHRLESGWEASTIKLWRKLCKNSNVIYDIGANTGVYSLIANAVQPNAEIVAFEPVNRIFKELERNVQLNRFNIRYCDFALSNYDGNGTFYHPGSEHIYSITINGKKLIDDSSALTNVQVAKLETLIVQKGFPIPDLLKIDVTHEPEVFQGVHDLMESRSTLVVEVLSDEVGKELKNLIENLKYNYFYAEKRLGPTITKDLRLREYYNYLITTLDQTEVQNINYGND